MQSNNYYNEMNNTLLIKGGKYYVDKRTLKII